jgi:hypothetical protein
MILVSMEAVTLQQRSHLCIPRKGIARPQSQFPHSVSVNDLYIPWMGPHYWKIFVDMLIFLVSTAAAAAPGAVHRRETIAYSARAHPAHTPVPPRASVLPETASVRLGKYGHIATKITFLYSQKKN